MNTQPPIDTRLEIPPISVFSIIVLSFIVAIIFNKDNIKPSEPIGQYALIEVEPVKSREELAIQLFIKDSNKKLSEGQIKEYADYIVKYSNEFNIDPFTLSGLVAVESKFDRYAVSHANAVGLTQVVPKWHKEKLPIMVKRFGHVDLFNPEHNIVMGVMIYAEYKDIYKDRSRSLLRYNGSLGHENPVYAVAVIASAKKAKSYLKTLTS